jgi:uncharacterized membrane protein YesL
MLKLAFRRIISSLDYFVSLLFPILDKSPLFIKIPVLIIFLTPLLVVAMWVDSKGKGSDYIN